MRWKKVKKRFAEAVSSFEKANNFLTHTEVIESGLHNFNHLIHTISINMKTNIYT